ncbi:MAG: hypothetical protein WCE38_23795, partial [Burkholderiales bacterium]
RLLMPVMDDASRRWLRRSTSPYIPEIEAIARALGLPGIWFLNGSYEWGCTALARDEDGAPWIARTLDWPFPGLGRRVEIARMRGEAGEFYNVTWPGYVGALTAMAPGRFAAGMNQAPLRRRMRLPWLRPADMALNALRTWRIRSVPPDHLLRNVFETAPNYVDARRRLEQTPIARPVIFILVGCEPGERCVIERTEDDFTTRTENTSAANDWWQSTWPWEARVSSAVLLTRTYDEAAANSRLRRETLAGWTTPLCRAGFAWVTPPVLNPFTRIGVEMCPATGTLRVAGYEKEPDADLPRQVTQLREIAVADA